MEDVQLTPEAIRIHKQNQGYTDEQLKHLTLTQRRFMNAAPKFFEYKVIAECVWARNCGLRPQTGSKFVFNAAGMLLPEESTFPEMCIWALAEFLPFFHIIYDRLAQGLDPNPVGWDHVKCADVGVENGGAGEVLFKIYCQKV